MPIWKMNFCSRFLRLSVVPRCREGPQIAMCFLGVVREIKMASDWLRCILVTQKYLNLCEICRVKSIFKI